MFATLLKGTDKVREGPTTYQKGWNVTTAGYELPQLSKDDYYKMKEEVKEQNRVALHPDLVYSQMQMKASKPIDICQITVDEQYKDWVQQSNTVRIFNNFVKLEHLTQRGPYQEELMI